MGVGDTIAGGRGFGNLSCELPLASQVGSGAELSDSFLGSADLDPRHLPQYFPLQQHTGDDDNGKSFHERVVKKSSAD